MEESDIKKELEIKPTRAHDSNMSKWWMCSEKELLDEYERLAELNGNGSDELLRQYDKIVDNIGIEEEQELLEFYDKIMEHYSSEYGFADQEIVEVQKNFEYGDHNILTSYLGNNDGRRDFTNDTQDSGSIDVTIGNTENDYDEFYSLSGKDSFHGHVSKINIDEKVDIFHDHNTISRDHDAVNYDSFDNNDNEQALEACNYVSFQVDHKIDTTYIGADDGISDPVHDKHNSSINITIASDINDDSEEDDYDTANSDIDSDDNLVLSKKENDENCQILVREDIANHQSSELCNQSILKVLKKHPGCSVKKVRFEVVNDGVSQIDGHSINKPQCAATKTDLQMVPELHASTDRTERRDCLEYKVKITEYEGSAWSLLNWIRISTANIQDKRLINGLKEVLEMLDDCQPFRGGALLTKMAQKTELQQKWKELSEFFNDFGCTLDSEFHFENLKNHWDQMLLLLRCRVSKLEDETNRLEEELLNRSRLI